MQYFGAKNLKSLFDQLMENIDLKIVFSFMAIAFDWIFGTDTKYLLIIAALIVMDTITGSILAAKRGDLSSYGFYRFSAKVLVYFALCATAKVIDKVLPVEIVHSIMFAFLAITETISVFENSTSLGFPVPKKLYRILKISSELLEIEGKDDK